MSQTTSTQRAPGDWSVPGGDFVGFGAAEMAYLLSRFEGPTVARTIGLLGLDPKPTPEFTAAGASSLLARGLVTVEGDQLNLVGPAAVAAYALAATQHWTEVGFMAGRERAADGALVLQAGDVVGLLRPRALGTWFFMVKRPEVTTSQSVLALGEAFFATHPDGALFLAAQTSEWAATLFLRKLDGGVWELARGEAPFWTADGVETADVSVAMTALDTLLTPPTNAGE